MRLLSSEIHCGLAFSDQLLDMFLDKQKNSSKIEVKIIDMDNGRDWQIRILLQWSSLIIWHLRLQ